MHDTIRDLALWIVCECGIKRDKISVIESFYGTFEKWYNAERIYLSLNCDAIEVPPLKSPNLLTLIFEWSPRILLVPQNFFQFMPLLRVLDLSYSFMVIFPTSITELLELQYLSLSRTHIPVLPEELRKLVKLKYLDLSHMIYLKKIPSRVIGSLLELRVLNLYQCSGAVWDLEEVYNLKHLDDLRITINTQHNLKIFLMSNQNLQMCTKHLYLQVYDTDFLFSSPSSSSTATLGVNSRKREKLKFLSNLETPSLDSLPEAELMNMNMGVWKNHYYMAQRHHLRSCFQKNQNLSKIEIYGCNALKDLTWVGYVGNLKRLYVSSCEELEEIVIVDDFGGTKGDEIPTMNIVDVFKRLQTLNMMLLPKLKSICKNALAFPCLETMEVMQCPELKKLPFDSGSNVNNTLRKITGERKWWNHDCI